MLEQFNAKLKNRKLFLNEYDDDGNLIESREMEHGHLALFISSMINDHYEMEVVRHKTKLAFTDTEWKFISGIVGTDVIKNGYNSQYYKIDFDNQNVIDHFKEILNHPTEKLEYTLNKLCSHGFICKLGDPYCRVQFTINEALEFIESRPGVYYAVNNSGENTYDFVDVPTRKQAEYRRKKYGDRIVFLSFEDWKEYSVSESELI